LREQSNEALQAEVVDDDLDGSLELGSARLVNLTTARRMGPPTAVRRFDSFVLDVGSRELRTGNRSVVLQTQPFEILLQLLGRAGQVVEREELRRRLWPEGTFVDYEHSLNAAIKRLRNALGDDAECPRFIETIPRRGYRFVAPVFDGSVVRQGPAAAPAHAVRLAVLPVRHIGAEGQFAEGFTEELRTQLARLSAGSVAVIARSPSMTLGGQPRRASEIGKDLRVEYLLEGSVRSEGDRVRITVCLVETISETNVWCDTVDCRTSATLSTATLSTQVDLATRLAQSLTRKLRACA
jgi:DNA-binding winged helix-turn-helix (wHTH) protein